MKMIDFTDCKKLVNSYEGADLKNKIEYLGDVYMLKFGQKLVPDSNKPMQASYSSAPVSEYLGSHIFGLAGIPVQETLLGTYDGKVVVACKDFLECQPNAAELVLVEFKKLENSYLASSTAGGRTPLYDNLVGVFSKHESLGDLRAEAEDRYWQTFVMDALIGNFDRHAGNWGYVLNKAENRIVDLAPVYDCGSSLYPQLNEKTMQELMRDRTLLEERVRTFPRAALRIGKSKVRYHEFLLSPEGSKARRALGEILPRIDFKKVSELIQQTPYISEVRREFYTHLLEARTDVILRPAYELYREERELEGDSPSKDVEVSLGSEVSDCRAAANALEDSGQTQTPILDGQNQSR